MKSSQANPEDVPLVCEGEQLQDSDGLHLLLLLLLILFLLLWWRKRLELVDDLAILVDDSISIGDIISIGDTVSCDVT